jgi:hypothetical protein
MAIVVNPMIDNLTLYTGPSLLAGVSSNGQASTHRTKTATISWSTLDEDAGAAAQDEIAAVVTLTPKLPAVHTAQSAQVLVTAP